MSDFKYNNGFGNHFESEAIPQTLPSRGNAPQKVARGLYAEQISGTAFTAPRSKNQRSWLYRIRPSVNHQPFKPYESAKRVISSFHPFSPNIVPTPQQLRWDPLNVSDAGDVDFVDGLTTLAGAGDSQTKNGLAIHIYCATKSMEKRAFYNSDGDMLIVPQQVALIIKTEFGRLHVPPLHIAVVQRGLKFKVDLAEPADATRPARGFICETFKGHFELPDLGPIGANGLANPKDFEYPVAAFEDTNEDWTVINKFMGSFYTFQQDHSPFDVVAFSGNYVPYRYDLLKFNTIGSISYDHPDPSIFTVLTCPTDSPGTAVCDFVIFPPRWLVAEDTFRPPYFHRNCMSEFMGNICGVYDAKAEGFLPGGASLHNMNSAHGPDAETFEKASNAQLKPAKVGEGSMSFMFESAYQLATTKWAIEESGKLQQDYWKAWSGLKKHFSG
ncbi:putative homogentisate 1,2-dioxygenase [Violaceomyces palustris]|uniref:Homogentisate 1,2-dioxygenase n=1 Tax=Violaceomyces palustris TaxID=1673888 RepID=A0ACD0P5P5_9BASI|nr:putative homogentisate 1,2-dioxygenase [Violaceomyces palustris]